MASHALRPGQAMGGLWELRAVVGVRGSGDIWLAPFAVHLMGSEWLVFLWEMNKSETYSPSADTVSDAMGPRLAEGWG